MEKERRITAPEGCEIEKVEIVDGVAVVTFREKERKLPKSWDEFCEMFPAKSGECYIDNSSEIENGAIGAIRRIGRDKNLLPDRATAEAVIALCQLVQLRNCYNGDWVLNWENSIKKYVIEFYRGKINTDYYVAGIPTPLFFKSVELRDEFLRNFRPLIEKLKPLYGIKEGGEE